MTVRHRAEVKLEDDRPAHKGIYLGTLLTLDFRLQSRERESNFCDFVQGGEGRVLFGWLFLVWFGLVWFFLSLFIYFERVSKQGRSREKWRERIPSRLHSIDTKPNAGLDIMNHEIMT